MTNISLLHEIPLGFTLLFHLVLLFAALEIGYRLGCRWRETSRQDSLDAAEKGGLAMTSLSAILGLLLAFTYGFVIAHHEARKSATISEANALGSAFLRAGLVAGPGSTELRQALLDYSRTRVVAGDVRGIDNLQMIVERSLEAQRQIWPATERIIEASERGPFELALVASVTDVLDAHTIRVSAAFDRLPRLVLQMLLFLAAVSLGVAGYNSGLADSFRRRQMSAFALVLAFLLTLIVDFDRPADGLVRVPQTVIVDTIAQMESEIGDSAARD